MKAAIFTNPPYFFTEFKNVMEKRLAPVDQVVDSVRDARIKRHREKLIPVVKTIIFCGKQNIPLRGHRDDAKYLSKSNINPSNFQALLDFRIDSGNKVLED